jgi:2,5-diketo-D-gluconate reductase A
MPVSPRVEQYKALVELKKQGLAKHIGVSNFTDKHIQDLLDAGLVRTIRSRSSAS